MKQLEDKIKDRLEGYESRLPEGDLTEFKALLDKSAANKKKHETPLQKFNHTSYIKNHTWFIPVAIAAGIALLITFGYSPQSETIIEKGTSTAVAENGGEQSAQRKEVSPKAQQQADNQATTKRAVPSSLLPKNSTVMLAEETHVAAFSEDAHVATPSEDTAQSEPVKMERLPESDSTFTASAVTPSDVLAASDAPTAQDVSTAPVMPTDSATMIASTASSASSVADDLGQSAKKNFLKWRTYLLSGAGTLALAYAILPDLLADDYVDDINGQNNRFEEGLYQSGKYYVCSTMPYKIPKLNTKTGDDSHSMPLRVGLSLRVPLGKRWSLTSGTDYSIYSSRINYSVSGDRKQRAHYLGIPVRADFTIAHSRWVDVYVGAGASADFCVYANEDGYGIEKDGASFALNGVGGVQLNITKNIGVFLDPTVSWNIPTDNLKLETYKSQHPFMFSLSSGVRFTLKR